MNHGIARVFSSVRLTVVLLLLLAAVMAAGTVYEAENGASAARETYWRAPWFNGFLLLLAANLVGCTYATLPSRTSRWAFLLVHQSTLVIFAGALVGRFGGVEAQLQLAEGEQKAELTQDANTVSVAAIGPKGPAAPVHLATRSVDSFPMVTEPAVQWPLEGSRTVVRVDRYFPDAAEVESIVPGTAADGPAVQLELAFEGESTSRWLLAGREPLDAGTMKFRLVGTAPPAADADARQAGPGSVLELVGPDRSFAVRLDMAGKEGQRIPIPGSPYTVLVRKLYGHFMMKEGAPADDPAAPHNPAVEFDLEGPRGPERRLAFALHPDFDDMHAARGSGVKARYTVRSRELVLYHDPATRRLTGRVLGLTEIVTGPMEPGKTYPLKEVEGLSVKVARVLPNARASTSLVNRSSEVRQPALRVTLEDGGRATTTWLPFGTPREVSLGEMRFVLEYTRQKLPLDFAVKLEKFTIGRNPGSNMPSSYESRVTVRDRTLTAPLQATISMNAPLVHRGWTFYQSSYYEGTPMTSVLQVTRDSGGPIVYVGFIGFMVGLFCSIWVRARRATAALSSEEEVLP